jgi:thiol-disulfide isomerase/thioredoxin
MNRLTVVAVALLAAVACDSGKKSAEPTLSRVNGVKREASNAAASSFCEAIYPAGELGKAFVEPAGVPVGVDGPALAGKSWRWVNLWATWCRPCVEEMALLGKWRESLAKDGLPIGLELWSVDDAQEDVTAYLAKNKLPPAKMRRLAKGSADLSSVLRGLGVDEKSPIPVHVLVDGNNNVRCVRVGSVGDESYAAVKSILSSG